MSTTVRVVVVDDQRLLREGLVTMLKLIPDVEVVATAADGEEAVAAAERMRPDIVLMDLRMPRVGGVEATRRVLAAVPTARVVVLTTYADDESVFAALDAGASGYLTKDAGADEIARAISAVRAGEVLFDPSVQRRLLETARSGRSVAAQPPRRHPHGLTDREAEVLVLIASGLSNHEIAGRLFISEATVKSHVNSIFSKTQVRDRAQAVRYAYEEGLIE